MCSCFRAIISRRHHKPGRAQGGPARSHFQAFFTKKQKKLRGLFLLLTGYEASSINTTLEATVHSWSLYMAQYGTRRWSMLKNATQVTSGPW
jgi:hypothetical protein